MQQHAASTDAGAASMVGDALGFAALMRERTKRVHREAERTGFIADLIRGRATRRGYAAFLRNLVPAYAALETALAASPTTPVFRAFKDPGLRRLPSLVGDLEAIVGPDWASTCPLVPEAETYARIVGTAADAGGLRLIAHAYARYLGDLSGGQILQPLLARMFGLGPHALAFYIFPAFPDVEIPKAAMRDALDSIAVESAEAKPLIEEAIVAFRHNIAVSEAVQAALA